jgi:Rrf2 family protein
MNTRFTVAIHTLTLLALHRDEPVTSDYVASSVNTNPVVIRRILGTLRGAGLVRSQEGSGGGWQLLRPPREITLCDVYRAVEDADEPLFSMHHKDPNPNCPVGGRIQDSLTERYASAKRALERELAGTTIESILGEVLATS